MHVLQRTAIARTALKLRRFASNRSTVDRRPAHALLEQLRLCLGGRIVAAQLRRTLRRLVDAQHGGAFLEAAKRFEGPVVSVT